MLVDVLRWLGSIMAIAAPSPLTCVYLLHPPMHSAGRLHLGIAELCTSDCVLVLYRRVCSLFDAERGYFKLWAEYIHCVFDADADGMARTSKSRPRHLFLSVG